MPASETVNIEQKEFWSDVKGPLWVEMQTQLDSILSPFDDKAMDLLEIEPGGKVLEIGCGTGTSTQKILHLTVWEIDPIQLLKGGIKWPREDTSWRKMTSNLDSLRFFRVRAYNEAPPPHPRGRPSIHRNPG